jgi:enoyl-CoA hydratase
MADNSILYNKKDHAGYITLNKPKERNRIDQAMAQELAEVCEQIKADPDIYLVVLTGTGDTFCAGGKIMHDEVFPGSEESLPGFSAAEAVASIDCPVLAAINGDAIGEGLELALACDIRIASDKAWLGLPQITEGRIPAAGGTQRLSRIAGKGKALEMVLTGESIDAQAALETGLVNKVVNRDSLMSEVESIVATLAGKAPLAMRYAKEAVNKGLDLTLEQGLRLEADLYFLLHTTSDRTEGVMSFLQRRKPQFEGK